MLDDRAKDLINREIDGELSDSERARCMTLLGESEAAREYRAELSQLNELLAQVPSLELPEQLRHRIVSQIQLPRPRKWFTHMAGWMQGRPISYGIAAGAGLLVAVAVYEVGPTPHGGPDFSSLVGTLARGEGLSGVVQLSYLDIDLPTVHGQVRLSSSEDLKLLRFDVASDAEVEFEVQLGGSGLTFGGFAQEAEAGSDNFSYSEGNLSVSNFGAQRFTVILRDVSAEAAASGGIVVSVRQDGKPLYHGVLSL